MVSFNERVKQDFYMQMMCVLMANSEKDTKVIMEKVNECVVEYGLKVNKKKSKVVCINGEKLEDVDGYGRLLYRTS